MTIDRMAEGERYLKEAFDQGGGDNGGYHGNAMIDDFLSGRDWEKHIQWAAGRPDGFLLEANAATLYLYLGRMHQADQHWEQAARRAEQQHVPDSAGGFYAAKAAHDALVSNCGTARDAARKGLALDHSIATVAGATLALALCGDTGPALKEVERAAAESPANTLYTDIIVPEVKAAAALAQHHPDQVAGLLSSAAPYVLVSKAPHLLGRASLEAKKPQQAITDFEPGIRYHAAALGEGGTGAAQAPDYVLCLLGTARAQAQFDKSAATRSYQQLLDIWKNADPDFIPAQEAKRELAALTSQAKN
jgi:tetratricopeptide (TPR) repeat protein